MAAERDLSATAAGTGPAAEVLLDQAFDHGNLVSLRSAVAAHGSAAGMSRESVEHLVLVAYELASNAVRHGGGRGQLSMSTEGALLRCMVRDDGPGFADAARAGRVRPDPTSSGGRGLWLVRCVAARLDLRSDSTGTTAVVEFPLR